MFLIWAAAARKPSAVAAVAALAAGLALTSLMGGYLVYYGPVSYTHLDVYKRQIRNSMQR